MTPLSSRTARAGASLAKKTIKNPLIENGFFRRVNAETINPREELKIRRWLKALEIAEALFEEDRYFTDYLEEIEAFIEDGNEKGNDNINCESRF